MKNCLIIICLLLFVSQSMFMIVAAFFLVIVLAIACLKFLNIRIKKTILLNFFQFMIKKYGSKIEIEGNILLGNDLSFEQKFLNNAVDKCSEESENCEVSFYFSKKSMNIFCETLIITKTIAEYLLDIVDSVMKQHFTSSLRQLGCCAQYMLDRRTITYPPIKSSLMPEKSSQIPDLGGKKSFIGSTKKVLPNPLSFIGSIIHQIDLL